MLFTFTYVNFNYTLCILNEYEYEMIINQNYYENKYNVLHFPLNLTDARINKKKCCGAENVFLIHSFSCVPNVIKISRLVHYKKYNFLKTLSPCILKFKRFETYVHIQFF